MMSVCLFVCLSACPRAYHQKFASNLHQFYALLPTVEDWSFSGGCRVWYLRWRYLKIVAFQWLTLKSKKKLAMLRTLKQITKQTMTATMVCMTLSSVRDNLLTRTRQLVDACSCRSTSRRRLLLNLLLGALSTTWRGCHSDVLAATHHLNGEHLALTSDHVKYARVAVGEDADWNQVL